MNDLNKIVIDNFFNIVKCRNSITFKDKCMDSLQTKALHERPGTWTDQIDHGCAWTWNIIL